MAFVLADRVLETSTTTGTGAYTLGGAVLSYQTFAASPLANGDTTNYFALDVDTNGNPTGSWETGLGTWGTGAILTRTAIYSSSNAGSAVSWTAGTRRVATGLIATNLTAINTGFTTLNVAATAASTAYVLTTNGAAATALNQIVVPTSSALAFNGNVVARQQAAGGTSSAGWNVFGVARREASGNIVIVDSIVNTLTGVVPTGWVLTCTADTTNQAVAITFSMGTTAINVKLYATINLSPLTYA